MLCSFKQNQKTPVVFHQLYPSTSLAAPLTNLVLPPVFFNNKEDAEWSFLKFNGRMWAEMMRWRPVYGLQTYRSKSTCDLQCLRSAFCSPQFQFRVSKGDLTGWNGWKLISFLLCSPTAIFPIAEIFYRHFTARVTPHPSPQALQTGADSQIPVLIASCYILGHSSSNYPLARNLCKLKYHCQNWWIVSPAVFWVAAVAVLELRHMIKLS